MLTLKSMRKDDTLLRDGVIYVLNEFEGAVFKFTGTGTGNYCEVRRSKQRPYKVECTTNIACEAYLGGDIITEEQYKKY